MDAGFVGERVAADDGLVGLDRLAGEPRQQLAGFEERGGLNAGRKRETVAPDAEHHDDLLDRRIAGALADAVDRALDLPHAALNRRQAVGHRQSQIVVAVRAEDDAVGVRDPARMSSKKLRVSSGVL